MALQTLMSIDIADEPKKNNFFLHQKREKKQGGHQAQIQAKYCKQQEAEKKKKIVTCPIVVFI